MLAAWRSKGRMRSQMSSSRMPSIALMWGAVHPFSGRKSLNAVPELSFTHCREIDHRTILSGQTRVELLG